jgi:hypothetical protein
LHSTKWSNGKNKKRQKSFSPPKNNLIQDLEENEENGYPVLNSNKTKINDSKEPNNVQRTLSKKKSCK